MPLRVAAAFRSARRLREVDVLTDPIECSPGDRDLRI
jgi:hypothetical protein